MRIFLTILLFISFNAQSQINLTIGKRVIYPALEGTLRRLDNGTYSAFPHNAQLSNGKIAMIFKESATHAAAGPLMFGISTGDTNYNYQQVVVSGNSIQCSNLGMGVGSADRIIIDWQTTSSGPVNFAYSDNEGQSWVAATNSYTYPAGYTGAEFGKIIRLGGGGLLKFVYLSTADTSLPSLNICLKSTDNGATWNYYSTIASRHRFITESETGPQAITNGHGRTSEIYGIVTNMGAYDTTTKVVVLMRCEEISAHFHYRSPDGGKTWERLSGTASAWTGFYTYAPPVEGMVPVHMINHAGTIYIFCGARQSGNYRPIYTTVNPDSLYNNTGYAAIQDLPYNANADANAAYVDFGYPEPISRYFPSHGVNEVLYQFYDSSPTSPGFPRYEMIIQKKIVF